MSFSLSTTSCCQESQPVSVFRDWLTCIQFKVFKHPTTSLRRWRLWIWVKAMVTLSAMTLANALGTSGSGANSTDATSKWLPVLVDGGVVPRRGGEVGWLGVPVIKDITSKGWLVGGARNEGHNIQMGTMMWCLSFGMIIEANGSNDTKSTASNSNDPDNWIVGIDYCSGIPWIWWGKGWQCLWMDMVWDPLLLLVTPQTIVPMLPLPPMQSKSIDGGGLWCDALGRRKGWGVNKRDGIQGRWWHGASLSCGTN